MNFSRFSDIQSWWEVPSIAYFCSLFRTAFNLLDFDIEELEEALLADGTEEAGNSLLTELIVRILKGCLSNNDISAFNYQMYLRRLFRRKCQDTGRSNPFNSDIDFQFLPLRTKVEILYALCDFRLDADDVFELFRNLEAESLRVEPLGWDDKSSAYWYFYGTRLYREDNVKRRRGKNKKRKKEGRKRGWFYGDDWVDDDDCERVWQVVCFTEEDWTHLTAKFRRASSKVERELYRSLSQNFLPEIPRLFQEKERLQRKRLLELAPRRTSSRVLQKIKQREESSVYDSEENQSAAREKRARRRDLLRTKSSSSDSTDSSNSEQEMPQKAVKKTKSKERKRPKNTSSTHKGEPPPQPVVRTGRKTNNSLASATGQIVIPDNVEPANSTRKKLKTSQIFRQTEEDIQTDMYKVLEQLTGHDDAWPFMDPVEEEFAPNYYAVIRRPMDLHKMEERLDNGCYPDFSMFQSDFKLIVNNCRLYNGQSNEYTKMVDNLQNAFDRLTEKYIHRISSSDEEIAVEYQIPTPSRKHKIKPSESPVRHKRQKTSSDQFEPTSSTSRQENHQEDHQQDHQVDEDNDEEDKKIKESHKKHDKGKKKRRGHHRHGKHSKSHKRSSHKSSHEKKHNKKHSKDKDREGKRSKQKKKKSKHHDTEPPVELKRSVSEESLESSNRSRSASPLPSIHTPSPSPTELDKTEHNEQVGNPDFLKDKFDKIKERRRHTPKEAWDSLFDFKKKIDRQKQNISPPGKDKNKKLRETIEKLKAKNVKYKDTAILNSLLTGGVVKKSLKCKRKYGDDDDSSDNDTSIDESPKPRTGTRRTKRSCAKSVSASKALEQAVKDISKWLDDAPKGSALSSPCDSPAQTISTEEHDNSRLDDEFSQGEKPLHTRKDGRKRPSSREPKTIKRREIQRTIERLQPGKSKGNLLTNMSNKYSDRFEETSSSPSTSTKTRESFKEESSPKLSLGSVLPTVEFSLGNDHNFSNEETKSALKFEKMKTTEVDKEIKNVEQKPIETKVAEVQVTMPTKKDAEVETADLIDLLRPNQEKATPNLSAWFKAFGAPKTTYTTHTLNAVKKKPQREVQTAEKSVNTINTGSMDTVAKITSPKNTPAKYDSPSDPNSPLPDSDDSPHLIVSVTPRQRRTSTGSSISERSSFSQDLDSPRHQMSLNSPLLRSPASPRIDDFQKITYPIINGTVRAGFYQDTTSLKSSPEKSCSPREAPQSPYSPYSQHVYASNSAAGSSTPNYFVDHNKSPLPTYGQNAPPYYDSSKAPIVSKPLRVHDDYTSLGPDSKSPTHSNGPFSPVPSPYPPTPTHSHYSQAPMSPQPVQQPNCTQISSDPKSSIFPVKKRIYEPEQIDTSNKISDKHHIAAGKVRTDYSKVTLTLQSVQTMSSTSVDDIALALSEKSVLSKLNSTREKLDIEFAERHHRERANFNNNELLSVNKSVNKKESHNLDSTKASGKKENIDMINMGYTDAESKRHYIEHTELDYSNREHKTTTNPQQKGYEIEAIAINLGIHSQQLSKPSNKPPICFNNTTPAHSHERTPVDISTNNNIAPAHQNQYDSLPTGQSINNFSLNDIEIANKKLYSCNTTHTVTAIDYGNWKMTNQTRKSETLPSDYSTAYSAVHDEKLKSSDTISSSNVMNYNKSIQQQYSNYNNIGRANTSRAPDTQQNHSAELRIPNPRSLLKSDILNPTPTISENDTLAKNLETLSKSQKIEKFVQNHPLVSSPYKTPYSTHSALPIESLRNLPSMLERFTNEDRYLQSFAAGTPSLYHDKTFQMAQIFNKSMSSEVHNSSSSVGIYSQAPVSISKDNNTYKNSSNVAHTQYDQKKIRRKKTSESKQVPPVIGTPQYHNTSNSDVLTSVKANMMATSPFNFGTTTNMALSGMYGDNGGFTIDDFRNSTNQLMAANYMAAAVAHQRNSEANAEKLAKPAHQNNHSSSPFPFLGHSQVRAGYPFVSTETSSPLYQQYLRYQEELQRQTGAQIMSLYPQAYAPASLGVRQPYDSINRPSWL